MIKKLKSSSPCEIMSCSLKHHKMSPDAAKTQENSDMCCSRNQSLLAAGCPPSAPPPRQRRRHLPALPPLPQPVTNFSADRLPLPGPGVTLPPPGPRSPPGRAAAGAGQGAVCGRLGGGGETPAPASLRACPALSCPAPLDEGQPLDCSGDRRTAAQWRRGGPEQVFPSPGGFTRPSSPRTSHSRGGCRPTAAGEGGEREREKSTRLRPLPGLLVYFSAKRLRGEAGNNGPSQRPKQISAPRPAGGPAPRAHRRLRPRTRALSRPAPRLPRNPPRHGTDPLAWSQVGSALLPCPSFPLCPTAAAAP